MASTRKKQIPALQRKKVTASARARVSTSRVRKSTRSRLEESFIQSSPPSNGLTDPNHLNLTTPTNPTVTSSQSDVMIDMLRQLTQSNQSLLQRVEKIEQQGANFHHTTVMGAPPTRPQPLVPHSASLAQQSSSHHTSRYAFNPPSQTLSNTLPTSNNCNCSASQPGVTASSVHGHTTALQHDGVVPSLENLRRLPNISQAVTNALAAYEDQAKSSLLGKQRRSGRYNTTDIAQNPPEIRWPNEGYHSSAGKKGVPYDELSMAQWVTGQLNNVYNMKDPLMARHALLQVILAIKDATSLPWGAVRSAWATSMHDLEEGNLHWDDATQWAINRLSASQMSMANSQLTQQHNSKKTCKFYNEGTCSYDNHHGAYRHICSYCERSGRSLQHPEVKCNSKNRSKDRQAVNS